MVIGWIIWRTLQENRAWTLGHRKTVIISVTALMLLSCAGIPLVGAEFMSSMDSGEISISLEMDRGTTIEHTSEVIDQMEKILTGIPEVTTIFTSIGSSGNMAMSNSVQGDKAAITVKLVPKDDRDKSVEVVPDEIRQKMANIPGAKIKVCVASTF